MNIKINLVYQFKMKKIFVVAKVNFKIYIYDNCEACILNYISK